MADLSTSDLRDGWATVERKESDVASGPRGKENMVLLVTFRRKEGGGITRGMHPQRAPVESV